MMVSRPKTSNVFLFVIIAFHHKVYRTPLHAAVLKHNIIISEVMRLGTAKESYMTEHFRSKNLY